MIRAPVDEARDTLIASGITINGLAVLASEPWLSDYYNQYVIGAPGTFLLEVDNFSSFATAMQNKLMGEIAGLLPSEHRQSDQHQAEMPLAWRIPLARM
jgi:hypothetical protein